MVFICGSRVESSKCRALGGKEFSRDRSVCECVYFGGSRIVIEADEGARALGQPSDAGPSRITKEDESATGCDASVGASEPARPVLCFLNTRRGEASDSTVRGNVELAVGSDSDRDARPSSGVTRRDDFTALPCHLGRAGGRCTERVGKNQTGQNDRCRERNI